MTKRPLPAPTTETIAVVDPDPAVRHSLEFALRTEGYRVTTFARGQDLLASMREPPACLISEYRLADMTGFDLVGKVRAIRQEVHFVLLVTYPDRTVLRRAQAENARIVEKPLLGTALLDEIRQFQTGSSVDTPPPAGMVRRKSPSRFGA